MTAFNRCAVVVFALATFAGGPTPVQAEDRIGQWTVIHGTKAVTVLAVEKTGPPGSPFSVTMQNTYGRPITRVALHVGTSKAYVENLTQPGGTTTAQIMEPEAGAEWVIHVTAVLFGDGPGAADGDPADVEYMRFERLGEAVESARCADILSSMKPTRLSDGPVSTVIGAVDRPARPVEAALESLPASPLREKVKGASAAATEAFLTGLGFARNQCRRSLEDLMKQSSVPSGSAGPGRAKYFSELVTGQQAVARSYQAVCDVDM